jgi:hypothetical protein
MGCDCTRWCVALNHLPTEPYHPSQGRCTSCISNPFIPVRGTQANISRKGTRHRESRKYLGASGAPRSHLLVL